MTFYPGTNRLAPGPLSDNKPAIPAFCVCGLKS